MQISTNVRQTTEVVALMPAALILQVASRVPVYLGIPEMDSHVPVNESLATSSIKQLSHKNNYLITTCKTSNSAIAKGPRCSVDDQKQRTLFIVGSLKSP